jgi:hypothetical protein
MSPNQWSALATAAFKLLGMKAQVAQEADGSYGLALSDGCFLQLQNQPANLLTLTSVVDIPSSDLETADLWNILQANLLRLEQPPIITAGLADNGGIVIWCREHLSQVDSVSLAALITRFQNHCEGVKSWLKHRKPKQGTHHTALATATPVPKLNRHPAFR